MTTLTPAEIVVKNLLKTAFIALIDDTAYRIVCCDETSFEVEFDNPSDGSPDQQTLQYSQVDLERDLIYKLELVNPK